MKMNAWKILDKTKWFGKISLTDTRHRQYKVKLNFEKEKGQKLKSKLVLCMFIYLFIKT